MFSVIALSVVWERPGQALNTLVVAAFILLLGNPQWLFSVGFQLSFFAVLSLLIFYKPICACWPQTNRIGRFLWQAVAASIAAEVLTAPLVAYYFHNFPLLFIIANLFSVALVGLGALIGGIAIIALCWIPQLALLVGKVVTLFVTLFNAVIVTLQQYNPDSFQALQIGLGELLLLYLLLGAMGYGWLQQQRTAILVALPAACGLLLLLCRNGADAACQDKLVVYNNGRQPLVERIRGTRYTTLAGQSAGNYHAREAHIGWHSRKAATGRDDPSFLTIGGRTVLLLLDSSVNSYTYPFPVDVLILCRPLRRLQPSSIISNFRAETIVIASRASPYQLRRWSDSCARHSVRFINVAEEGAYIIE